MERFVGGLAEGGGNRSEEEGNGRARIGGEGMEGVYGRDKHMRYVLLRHAEVLRCLGVLLLLLLRHTLSRVLIIR